VSPFLNSADKNTILYFYLTDGSAESAFILPMDGKLTRPVLGPFRN
jgi:hypothetical protein